MSEKDEDYSTRIYLKLLFSIFNMPDKRIKDMFDSWSERGICPKRVDDETMIKIFSNKIVDDDKNIMTNVSIDPTKKKPFKKTKKNKRFQINDINFVDKDHVAYYFIKSILLLKPNLHVIGTTLYMFKDDTLGIRLYLLNKHGLSLFEELYENRRLVFESIDYTFCYNVMYGTHLKISTIPFSIRMRILIIFHFYFIENAFLIMLFFKKNPEILETENFDVEHIDMVLIDYMRKYMNQLTRVILEVSQDELLLGIYESEKQDIINSLKLFVDSTRNIINRLGVSRSRTNS